MTMTLTFRSLAPTQTTQPTILSAQMRLSRLVDYVANELNLRHTAEYFRTAYEEIAVVDGVEWINADFVRRHCTVGMEDTQTWREIDANVTTYLGLKK